MLISVHEMSIFFLTKFISFTWKPNKGAEGSQPFSSVRRTALGQPWSECVQGSGELDRTCLAISVVYPSTWDLVHLGVVLQRVVFVEMKEYTDLLEERIVHIRGRGELSAVSKAKEVEKNLHELGAHKAAMWGRLPK